MAQNLNAIGTSREQLAQNLNAIVTGKEPMPQNMIGNVSPRAPGRSARMSVGAKPQFAYNRCTWSVWARMQTTTQNRAEGSSPGFAKERLDAQTCLAPLVPDPFRNLLFRVWPLGHGIRGCGAEQV